ncbi:hypothetical protein BaRGS_00040292, partial [Batillaria attramentaria]
MKEARGAAGCVSLIYSLGIQRRSMGGTVALVDAFSNCAEYQWMYPRYLCKSVRKSHVSRLPRTSQGNQRPVWDGPDDNGELLASYCDTVLPAPLVSPGNTLYIKLATSITTPGIRFHASWTTQCADKVLSGDNGNISSPLFPNAFREDGVCKWTVSVDAGKVIVFTFEELELGPQTDPTEPCIGTREPADVSLYDGIFADKDLFLGRGPKRALSHLTFSNSAEVASTNIELFTYGDARRETPMGKHLSSVKIDLTPVGYIPVGSRNMLSVETGQATFQIAVISNPDTAYAVIYYQEDHMNWEGRYKGDIDIYVKTTFDSVTRSDRNPYSQTQESLTMDRFLGNTGYKGTWIYKIGDFSQDSDQECEAWYKRNEPKNSSRVAEFDRLPQCPCSEFRIDAWSLITDPPNAGHATAFNPSFRSLVADYNREDKEAHYACCVKSTKDKLCKNFYDLRPLQTSCSYNLPLRFANLCCDPHIMTIDGKEYVFNGWGEYTLITLSTPELNFTLQGRTDLAETDRGQLVNATVFSAFGAEENNVRVFVGLNSVDKASLDIYASGREYSREFKNRVDFRVEEDEFTLIRNGTRITLAIAARAKSLVVSLSVPTAFQNLTLGLLGNFNGNKDDDFILPNGTVLRSDLTEREIFEYGKQWQVTRSNSVMIYKEQEPAYYARLDFTPKFLSEQPTRDRQNAENLCGQANIACIYDYLATSSETFAMNSKLVQQEAEEANVFARNTVPQLDVVPSSVRVTHGIRTTFSITGRDPDENDALTYHTENDWNGLVTVDPATGTVTYLPDVTQSSILGFYVTDSRGGQSSLRVVPVMMCSGCSGHGNCDFTRYSRREGRSFNFQFAVCVCEPAWDGFDCERDRDGCLGNPCMQHQNCTDLTPDQQGSNEIGYDCGPCPSEGSFTCRCDEGYTLDTSRSTCIQDPTTQSICSDAGCTQGCRSAQAPAGNRGPECFCYSGYDLDRADNRTCRDSNECEDSENADSVSVCTQKCINFDGGFECYCYSGYQLSEDKRTCNPCPRSKYGPNCELNCRCSDRSQYCDPVGGCICESGWEGTYCQDDIDECLKDPHICGNDKICINTIGSYTCSCLEGYELDDSGHCTDIDECSTDSVLNTCGDLEQCVNVPGSFHCTCIAGYQRTNTTCTDVNECAAGNDDCQQICVNVLGSYNCDCHNGYRLNTDRTSCSEVSNACADVASLNCQHGCTLSDNNTAVCFCRAGYQLDRNQQTCHDINECAAGTPGCSHACDNTDGGFLCSCPLGMKLDNDGRTCI